MGDRDGRITNNDYNYDKNTIIIVIQFFIICAPNQQFQGQLQKQHSVDTGNYTTDKEKHKDNSYKTSLGNSAVGKLPCSGQKSIRVKRER
jgi:hypothetical protein